MNKKINEIVGRHLNSTKTEHRPNDDGEGVRIVENMLRIDENNSTDAYSEDLIPVSKDTIFMKAIHSLIFERIQELEQLKELADFKPSWTTAEPFATVKIGSKCIGVYRIIYRPTDETKYIGEGNISQRRSRHKGCFLNGGEDMVSANGHVSPSQTAKKMYNYDPNIDNWLFSFCIVDIKAVSTAYETELIKKEKPEFNLLSMAGNG